MAFGLCRSGRRGLRDVIDDATMNALFYLEAKLISMNVFYIVLCLHNSEDVCQIVPPRTIHRPRRPPERPGQKTLGGTPRAIL